MVQIAIIMTTEEYQVSLEYIFSVLTEATIKAI